MTLTVGLVGAGYMGAGLGWALRQGGARVVTCVAGRSERTARLVLNAGLESVASLDYVVSTSDVLLSVVPPASALDAAREVADALRRRGSGVLYADLNAVSPVTVRAIAELLAGAGADTVDGAISGVPPSTRPGATVYFSGPRAQEIVDLPWRDAIVPVVVSAEIGAASAVKMCTASVYKGLSALMTNALATAATHGVVDVVVEDLKTLMDPAGKVALAASKSARFVGEMHEIAATQEDAGLSPALFEAIADVFAKVATTDLAKASPEEVAGGEATAADVVARLRTGRMK